ncbi:hypothetical protein NLG97_g6293 [Lecanicillium saksenae]|uniref:Uncharacterized protein n=1 Tax=Lecanicillium saksenae TaxID=468837 RepID=A0ACC1QSL7_9HYPO|nr:hypothetical protein NLG97_g6293 [Lecanicillium saksenae]
MGSMIHYSARTRPYIFLAAAKLVAEVKKTPVTQERCRQSRTTSQTTNAYITTPGGLPKKAQKVEETSTAGGIPDAGTRDASSNDGETFARLDIDMFPDFKSDATLQDLIVFYHCTCGGMSRMEQLKLIVMLHTDEWYNNDQAIDAPAAHNIERKLRHGKNGETIIYQKELLNFHNRAILIATYHTPENMRRLRARGFFKACREAGLEYSEWTPETIDKQVKLTDFDVTVCEKGDFHRPKKPLTPKRRRFPSLSPPIVKSEAINDTAINDENIASECKPPSTDQSGREDGSTETELAAKVKIEAEDQFSLRKLIGMPHESAGEPAPDSDAERQRINDRGHSCSPLAQAPPASTTTLEPGITEGSAPIPTPSEVSHDEALDSGEIEWGTYEHPPYKKRAPALGHVRMTDPGDDNEPPAGDSGDRG